MHAPVHEVPPPPQPPSLKTGARREDERASGVRRWLASLPHGPAAFYFAKKRNRWLKGKGRSRTLCLPTTRPLISHVLVATKVGTHHTPPQRRRATLLLLAQVTGHFQPLTKLGTRKCLLQFIDALMTMSKKCCKNSNARGPKATNNSKNFKS